MRKTKAAVNPLAVGAPAEEMRRTSVQRRLAGCGFPPSRRYDVHARVSAEMVWHRAERGSAGCRPGWVRRRVPTRSIAPDGLGGGAHHYNGGCA
jgi:hypothetical protein